MASSASSERLVVDELSFDLMGDSIESESVAD